MHPYLLLTTLLLLSLPLPSILEVMQNLRGSEIHNCIKCLCHARTGCYNRFNCASYSINTNYWIQAGSPTVSSSDDPSAEDNYKKCMRNENCIVNAIQKYTESFGKIDCNCDGRFDCKDRLAIHLFGEECTNPKFGKTYATRFNHCAASIGVKEMLESEGSSDCTPEVF